MVIKVRCPQGHSIACKDEMAGQTGKCPKCGEKIKVPGEPAAVTPPDDDSIVFLCPNGHKLNGPASLQGRPGQCPHCQARFVIPDYSEPDEEAEATIVSKAPWNPGDNFQQVEDLEPIESLEEPLPEPPANIRYIAPEATPVESMEMAGDLSIEPHPTAAMFRRLWQERQDGRSSKCSSRTAHWWPLTVLRSRPAIKTWASSPARTPKGAICSAPWPGTPWPGFRCDACSDCHGKCFRSYLRNYSSANYSSAQRSASVSIEKPLAARVSWAISRLSTIKATAGRS